jgi:hypothetical protein
MLAQNGDLLPVLTDGGTYYVFNMPTFLSALDVGRSSIDRLPSGLAKWITCDAFRPECVTRPIFRLEILPSNTYVTDAFAAAVAAHRLTGFVLTPVWSSENGPIELRRYPLPVQDHDGQHDEFARARRAEVRAALASGAPIPIYAHQVYERD